MRGINRLINQIMLTEADTGQTQAKTKEQQEAEFKSALEAAKASGMPQEEIDRITKERELQKALENPVQYDPKNDPIAKSEKERTIPSMGAISDAESIIGHAMAVGDSMRTAELTGKIPVGTYPGQTKEIPYITGDFDNTSKRLAAYHADVARAARDAGATPEQLERIAGPQSTADTVAKTSAAAQDIILTAASGIGSKGLPQVQSGKPTPAPGSVISKQIET